VTRPLARAPAELGAGVRYRFTDRNGGGSKPPYQSLNLGAAVGDDPADVSANRRLVAEACGLDQARGLDPAGGLESAGGLDPAVLVWMRQVHGATVRYADGNWPGREPEPCDAVFTDKPGLALGVLVADCVPVLLADPQARLAGAAHAGREGLVAGVVPALVAALIAAGGRANRIRAAIGPAICGGCYEVAAEMQARVAATVPSARCRTRAGTAGLDIRAGVQAQLTAAGVRSVSRDPRCTRETADLFSYRRDGTTGRAAGLIWLEP
jgi:YfiH family protein